MSPGEQYASEQIRYWVWSGFHDRDDVFDMLEDILEDDADPDVVEEMVEPAFERKEAAETAWPEVTACDRLDDVFARLHDDGICALAYAGYTMADGHGEVSDAIADALADDPTSVYHGYCFYIGEDVERAVNGYGLSLAFGDLDDDLDRGVAVGAWVVESLRRAGFTVEWDGTLAHRIEIPDFDWKRRFDPEL